MKSFLRLIGVEAYLSNPYTAPSFKLKNLTMYFLKLEFLFRKRERENELEEQESAKRQKEYEKKWDVSLLY